MGQVSDGLVQIKRAVVAQLAAINFDVVSFAGLAASSTPTSVNVGSTDLSWIGQRLQITLGTGIGYEGVITDISGGSLVVDTAWLVQPDTTSKVVIGFKGPTVIDQIDVDADTTNIVYPCFVAVTSNMRRKDLSGDSRLRQYDFPVGIMLLDNAGAMAKAHEREGLYLTWLKLLDDAFHQRRLSGLYAVDTRVEPWDTFEQQPPKYQYVRSRVIVWCEVFDDRN